VLRKGTRWAARGLLALILALMAAGGGGIFWLRTSLSQVDGVIRLAGLEAPVTVVRDRFAIPHIAAENMADAGFALGFVHAQDRLWQMEFQRRLGAGRLSEIVGPAALPGDRFMRTLGLYRRAEAGFGHLEPATRAWLEAYAAGVNAYLATRSGAPPLEFLILRHERIEPWRPADSLVWVRVMALDLSLNWQDELARARLAGRLSREQIADLWPDYPDDAPVTLSELAAGLPFDALAGALPQAPLRGQGSNAWVVAGSRSATGAPLLANDPHLGLQAPGVWYLAHLRSPGAELIGATLPGVPAVALGNNGTIAWGLTNTGPDTQDLFVERIDPSNPGRYLAPGGALPFATREEVIRIKGEEPVVLVVRETRHGPVLSGLLPDTEATFGGGHAVALSWTGLDEDDATLQALLGLASARDWETFVEALSDVGSPMQNVLYADVHGHIGFIAPGRVPVRKAGDGRWPVPGWTGAYDWQGLIPYDELPRALDPQAGVLLNANNRIVPENFPHFLTADWEPAYRARRLEAALEGDGHSLESFARLQADQLSLLAEDFLPVMLEAEAAGGEAAAMAARLSAWDRVMRVDAAEPLVFAAWYRELSRLIYADELRDLFPAFWGIRPRFMARVLSEREVWCDDVGTDRTETCAELIARALEIALEDLGRRFGDHPTEWRWGRAHLARMTHAPLGEQPWLAWLLNVVPPTGGDGATIDVGHYRIRDPERPFANVLAPSYRGLYDLADLDRSRFVAATGQSGNPLSAHYRDLTELWRRGATVSMSRHPDDYEADAIGRLRLEPAR
jgi:penicillin G amidase